MQTIPHFINGEHVSDAERFAPVYNPATGAQEKQVVLASTAQVEDAIAAAAGALPGWRATSLAKRTAIFFRCASLSKNARVNWQRF